MTFPLYKFPETVDYHELIKHVEKKYGINTRDYAGRWSTKGKEEKELLRKEWLNLNGYSGKEYVLNKPEGSDRDWQKGSYELSLRVEINSKRKGFDKELEDKYPYLDYWHTHCDEVNKGGVNYLDLSDEGKPKWVCEINKMIRDELVGCPAYDAAEQVLRFHVDW